MTDMVNAPPHYTADPSGVECIEIIEKMSSPLLANTVRYLWRYLHKWDASEDCSKAAWYVRRFGSGPGFGAPHSRADESAPFLKWRASTTPSLASAAITMTVLMDSGKCARGTVARAALLDVIDEVGKGADREVRATEA